MDAAALFEDALKGLATKDDDEPRPKNTVTKLSPDSAIVADAKQEEPTVKLEEDDEEDIIARALNLAGVDLSPPATVTNNGAVPPGSIFKVFNGTGNKIVRIATAADLGVHGGGSPRMASQLIKIAATSSEANAVGAPCFPLIRKRPNPDQTALPKVKIIRTAQINPDTHDAMFRQLPFTRPRYPHYPMNPTLRRDEEIDEDDTGDLAQAETYADYSPAKLHIGSKHPDPIVESSTLSSVSPPDIHYTLHLPQVIIQNGLLSALQIEAVVYASQRHQCILPNGQRAGFLIGDGAGVGKGRTIAGIIYENYIQRRKKAIWLSVSNDLRVDAERDLHDIGLDKLKVHSLNKFRYARISGKENGRVKKGVLFSTYSSLIGESQGSAKAKYKTRLKQIVHWCGKDFDGVVVLDECHRAKNLTPSGSQKPTKTGLTVLELQNRLPNARIVYASATGATEPRNMAYMTRLGLWGGGTPFKTFNSFIQSVDRRGVGGMELVAMDMKLRGMYIARQLSFHGVNFTIRPVEIENVTFNGESFVTIYNQSADLWVCAYRFFCEACRLLGAPDKFRKTMWGQFWSAHQRFFKYLCIAAKVDACVELCRTALSQDKCVVIGLQSTGEAKTLEHVDEFGADLGEFVSTAKGVFQSLIDKYFPTSSNMETFAARGDKLASATDRSSSTTLSRAGRAVAGGQGSGLGLKDILGEKMLAKLIAGGTLSGLDDDDDGGSGGGAAAAGSGGGKKSDSDINSSDDDDEDSGDDGDATTGRSKRNGAVAASSSSEYYDSDLELNNGGSSAKRPKKSGGGTGSSRRKQLYDSDAATDNDDDEDMDLDALCDDFIAREKKKREIQQRADSLWADETTRELSNKYLLGIKRGDPTASFSVGASGLSQDEARRQCDEMQKLLLNNIDRLGRFLPPSSLDELIEKLGGPSRVAEMTGRRGRMVIDSNGRVLYESRREGDVPMEVINLAEKQRFMDGEKLIAIVSEAASSGISLQADRRIRNPRRRVHITLELPWSADRAIQQFGRTHRSNQVSSPEYIFLISDLAGEQRFASTVAKRLESLGALTHGDRRATETRDLSRFNIDTKMGREALEIVLKTFTTGDEGIVNPPSDYVSDTPPDPSAIERLPPRMRRFHQFFSDVMSGLQGVGFFSGRGRERDSRHMVKFLNRILGMHVHTQNALFRYFSDTLEELIRRAKRDNRLDLGIMDLGTTGQDLEIIWTKTFDTRFLTDSTQVHLHKVTTQRGVSWAAAMEIYTQHDGDQDGFYMPKQTTSTRSIPLLAFCLKSQRSTDGKKRSKLLYRVVRPNTGIQTTPMEFDKLAERYSRVTNPADCQEPWSTVFAESARSCIHLIQRNFCSRVANRNSQGQPGSCEVGLRERTYYVLSGSVLNVWAHIEQLLSSRLGTPSQSMQVVRLKPKEGKRIVGVLIPQDGMNDVLDCLARLQADPNQLYASIQPPPTPNSINAASANRFSASNTNIFSTRGVGSPSAMGRFPHSFSTSSLPALSQRYQHPSLPSSIVSQQTGFRDRSIIHVGGGLSSAASPISSASIRGGGVARGPPASGIFSPRTSFSPQTSLSIGSGRDQRRAPSRLTAAFSQQPGGGMATGYSPRHVTPMPLPQQRTPLLNGQTIQRTNLGSGSRLNWASVTPGMIAGSSTFRSNNTILPQQIQQHQQFIGVASAPSPRFNYQIRGAAALPRPPARTAPEPTRPNHVPRPLNKVRLVWKNG